MNLPMSFDPQGQISVVTAADKLDALRALAAHRLTFPEGCRNGIAPYLSADEVLAVADGQAATCCEHYLEETP